MSRIFFAHVIVQELEKLSGTDAAMGISETGL